MIVELIKTILLCAQQCHKDMKVTQIDQSESSIPERSVIIRNN